MNSNEVFHLWANAARPYASAGNVSFDALKLLSYRTVIAQIFRDGKGNSLAVFTSRNFSVTTNKHLSLARRAWSGPALTLNLGGMGSSGVHTRTAGNGRHEITDPNLLTQWGEELRADALELARQQSRARSDWRKESLASALLGRLDDCKRFAAFFRVKNPCALVEASDQGTGTTLQQLEHLAAKASAKKERNAKRAAKARLAELADAIEAWKKGERLHCPHTDSIFLRLVTEGVAAPLRSAVETSWGARVPLSDAVRLFRLAELVKRNGEGWSPNQFASFPPVGAYRLERIDSQGNATVGCHKLAFAEMQRLADSIGERAMTETSEAGKEVA